MMTTVKADNHHINNIDENMTYRCESCDQIFNSGEQLVYHQIQEHASKTDLTSNINADREENERQQQEEEEQPNAITMAEHLKDEASLQKKAKLGDGSNITAEDR
jgi:hypothetical protein